MSDAKQLTALGQRCHSNQFDPDAVAVSSFFAPQTRQEEIDAVLSDSNLEMAFGTDGSFSICGMLPQVQFPFLGAVVEEAPFSVREWKGSPQSLDRNIIRCLMEHWGVEAINSKGRKSESDHTIGQDNLCMTRLSSGWEVFGVFDGHGSVGHWPATRAARTLPYFLQTGTASALLAEGKVEEALKMAFKATQEDLETASEKQEIDLSLSGATAVAMLRHAKEPDHVWVAWAGDSRAAMIHPDHGVVYETSDHKPSRADETQRIEDSGGAIMRTTYDDGFVTERVVIKGFTYPGLAVTRSLGDMTVKAVGVVAEPECVRWSVKGYKGAYVIIASDGVWEFIETKRVSEIVFGAMTSDKDDKDGWRKRGVTDVLTASRKAWHADVDPVYCDDISMILAPITGLGAPRCDDAKVQRAVERGTESFCVTRSDDREGTCGRCVVV